MKYAAFVMIAFLLLMTPGFRNKGKKMPGLTCVLTSDKQVYKIGEIPQLKVGIINTTKKDIYLIGSLDGSDCEWRRPYCYYAIEKPKRDIVPLGRCGVMNTLRAEDFRLVKSGETFNPYGNDFFSDYVATMPKTYKNPGVYKIQFHYNSNCDSLIKFRGTPNASNRDSATIDLLFKSCEG